jgi:hypothetical protein
VSLLPALNLSPVSLTPLKNDRQCNNTNTNDKFFASINDTWLTIIAGDNRTGDKFIASINDTGEQLSPVTMTPVINFRRYHRHR